MKRILAFLLTLTPVSAAVGGAELNATHMINLLQPVFNMIKTLIVNDLSRTILTFILLFIVINRVLKTAIDKTPLRESSSKISLALAGIVIISIFFRARNFLDRFSWIIIFVGLGALIFPILGKMKGKFFSGAHGHHGDYSKAKDAKAHEKKEKKETKEIIKESEVEEDLSKEEHKNVEGLDSQIDQLEGYINKIRELRRKGYSEEQVSNIMRS